MGLREAFQKAAQATVKAFGNVPIVVTYTVYGTKTYDPETEIVTTPETDYTGIKMFFSSYSEKELAADENILPTDIKAILAAQDLAGVQISPNNTVTVTSAASITIRSGDTFSVIGEPRTDAAEAVYEIHLRAVA